MMNGPGHEFFAGSARAGDEHGAIGPRGTAGQVVECPHRRRLADEIGIVVLGLELLSIPAKLSLLRAELDRPSHFEK